MLRVGSQGDRQGSPLHVRRSQQRINAGMLGILFHLAHWSMNELCQTSRATARLARTF